LINIIDRDLLLHSDCAANCTVDTAERDEQRIAASLNNLTAVFPDRWVDKGTSKRAKATQGADIVETDEPTVTDHIRTNDSNEPSTACGLAGEVRVEPTSAH
jgi:hypothetical protein